MNKMKIKLTIFVVILVLFALTGCCFSSRQTNAVETTIPKTTTTETIIPNTTTQSVTEENEYNIGDTGPAGGLIFYINPNYETDGWRYLEAAPGDQSTGIEWDDGDWVSTWTKKI